MGWKCLQRHWLSKWFAIQQSDEVFIGVEDASRVLVDCAIASALLTVVACSALNPGASAATPDLQVLLRRVASRLAAPQSPQLIETEIEEELDGNNRVTRTRITTSSLTCASGATLLRTVVLASEDGHDITRRVRDDVEHHRSETPRVDLELRLPLEQSQQWRYVFTRVGGTDAEPLVRFEPRGAERHRLWVGQARIDSASGTILEAVGRPAVLPRFVDQIDVHMEFAPEGPPGPQPARLQILGAAHFLFFHKRMRYTSILAMPDHVSAALGGR